MRRTKASASDVIGASRFLPGLMLFVAVSLGLAALFRHDRAPEVPFSLAVACVLLSGVIHFAARRYPVLAGYWIVPVLQLLVAYLIGTTSDDIFRMMDVCYNVGLGVLAGWYFGQKRSLSSFITIFSGGTVVIVCAAAASSGFDFPTIWASVSLSVMAVLVAYSVARLRRKENEATCKDSLTGALNRKGLDQFLETLNKKSRRSDDRPSVLVLLDLDGFKLVNDADGHLAGDKILEDFAQHWLCSIRATDCFVRIGGDEFLLILKGSSLSDAKELVDLVSSDSAIAFSYGITMLNSGEPVEQAFTRADTQLYSQKGAKKDPHS